LEVQGFLTQAIVYLASAIIIVPISRLLGLGSIIGYLLAGVLIGPSALGLMSGSKSVVSFAELGVVLLLFVIGLELRPETLRNLRRWIFALGSVQVVAVTLTLTALLCFFDLSWGSRLALAFGLSLSSTAFVLQMLGEREELGTDYGRGAFGVLVFQDIVVIPALAILPILSAQSGDSSTALNLIRSVAVIAGVILIGKLSLQQIFRAVAKIRAKEIFTATALLLVLGIAAVMHYFEISMGLGAFLAGILLADSEYRHEIEADIEPFKGLLMGLFFISVGMTLDIGRLVKDPLTILALVACLMLVKAIVMFPIARRFGFEKAGAINLSLSLSQGGEFAFVFFGVAASLGLLPTEIQNTAVLVVTLSMAASPVVYSLGQKYLYRQDTDESEKQFDHVSEINPVIVAGFGRFGQMIGRTLRMKGIGFTALEHDPSQVETVRKFGNKIFYGDASRLDLLQSAGLDEAKIFVLAIDDPDSSVETARVVRMHFPKIKIIARARNRDHYFRLRDLGIQMIFRETFYSGIEAARKTLVEPGENPVSADIAINYFIENDFRLIEEQYQHHQDEEKVIAASKRSAAQLGELFKGDLRS